MRARFAAQFPKTGWSGIVDERGIEWKAAKTCQACLRMTLLLLNSSLSCINNILRSFIPICGLHLWVRPQERGASLKLINTFLHSSISQDGLMVFNHEMGKQPPFCFHLLMMLPAKKPGSRYLKDNTLWWLNKLLLWFTIVMCYTDKCRTVMLNKNYF